MTNKDVAELIATRDYEGLGRFIADRVVPKLDYEKNINTCDNLIERLTEIRELIEDPLMDKARLWHEVNGRITAYEAEKLATQAKLQLFLLDEG